MPFLACQVCSGFLDPTEPWPCCRWDYLHMAILQFLAGTRLIWDLAPTGPNAQRYSGLSLLGQEIPFPPFPIQDPLADLLCLGPGPGIPQSVSPQEQMPQIPPNLKIFPGHMQNCMSRRENSTKCPKFSTEASNLDYSSKPLGSLCASSSSQLIPCGVWPSYLLCAFYDSLSPAVRYCLLRERK